MDKYKSIREYLDCILEPLPVWVTTQSTCILSRLYRELGKEHVEQLLDDYFSTMGRNGQLDPFNPWRFSNEK